MPSTGLLFVMKASLYTVLQGERKHGLNHSALLTAHRGVVAEADCAK